MEHELWRIDVSDYPLPFLTLDDDCTYSEEESLRGESSDFRHHGLWGMGFRQTHLLKDVSDDGGPSRVEDTNAELVRQVHLWKKLYPTQIKELKEEHDTLKFQYALEVNKTCWDSDFFGQWESGQNALQVEIKH